MHFVPDDLEMDSCTKTLHMPPSTDPMCLIQPIATHSQHGNARVQPIMISKLAGKYMYITVL